MTPLKRVVTLARISRNEENSGAQKKAVVFIGRQHPGETASSFVLEEIIQQLLLPVSSNEMEFLLGKFDFYLIPMLNVDGVLLGNYRCNANGFDLNRGWDREEGAQPEVSFVKN